MRIGIEAQRLFRPHKHGMDRVALELILNLQVLDKENEYFIFVKPDLDRSVISNTENFTVVEIPGGPYPIWEQIKLPKVAATYRCDLLHCTSNTAPFSKKTPLITTLHDIIYMEGSVWRLLMSKASLYQKFGNLYRRVIVRKVVENSRRLITVSNFEKKNITNFFKLKANEIHTIHNGVSEQFKISHDAGHLERVRSQYKLPDRYLLHLANKDPRKNTKRVLLAYKAYLNEASHAHPLLMLGYKEEDLKVLLNEIGAIELLNHIVLTGYVADEDLPMIYQLAQLFLFPSLREGFGIPIIEAMACGIPVITSNTSSMPEVAGNAAHLVDPFKTEEITEGILKILSDKDYRNDLIKKGQEQCTLFTWSSMATQVLEQYRQVYQETNI
jgi:glycosyltransferase involved in cell wall biosynthesis